MNAHERYMRLALYLAAIAREKTYPNPMVGAVIVRGGRVIGRGYHKKAGGDHAEVAAIKSVKGSCKGAVMYVTLEPCDHYGKTPPCAAAIIESGIKEVYAAMKDPNPINSGRGTRTLKSAGVKVKTGLCGADAREINKKYIKFITRGLPYVTVKLAQSLDGKIAARDGSSKWISSVTSRKLVKKMRGSFDAVMVGVGTVTADDPFLLDENKRGYSTRRIVVDTTLRMPKKANLIRTAAKSPVIIATTMLASEDRIREFERIKGVEVIVADKRAGKVDMKDLLIKLAKKGIVNILVEGGGELVGSLVDEGLADEFLFFISKKIIGGGRGSIKGSGVATIADAIKLSGVEISVSGDDILIRGRTCLRA